VPFINKLKIPKKRMKRKFSKAVRTLLRGGGQVMFQGNAWTGLWFLAGIVWGAWVNDAPEVLLGALLGLTVSTLTGWWLRLPHADGRNGLWSFNGILVGCAFPTFLAETPLMWVLLMVCAAFTVWLRTGMNRLMEPLKCNSLTFPFVLSTWIFLLAAQGWHAVPWLADAPVVPVHPTLDLWVEAWLKGVSQVFLLDSWGTGLCFLIGLYLSSPWACLWAMIGSALSLLLALAYGAPTHLILHGLYSYSAVLTAIALGCTFYRPGLRSAVWTVLGVVVTVALQGAFDVWLRPWGLPSLTAPFCVATWLFLWPLFRWDQVEADHSHWHRRG
jgi:urea transporter